MRRSQLSLVVCAAMISTSSVAMAAQKIGDLNLTGDIRLRNDMVTTDGVGTDDRHAQKLRLRFGVDGKLDDNVTAGFGLATTSFSEPASRNVTLGDDLEAKTLGVDLAYLAWTQAGGTLTLGKMKNPLYRPLNNQMIWDNDIRPEGASLNYGMEFGTMNVFVNVGAFRIDTITSTGPGVSGEDESALVGQAGLKMDMGAMGLTVGGGYHKASENLGTKLIEGFAAVDMELASMPTTVGFNYVTNSEADSDGAGWIAGLELGKTEKAGSYSLHYNYRDVKANTGLAYSDSEFVGGNAGSGHEVGVNYQLSKALNAGATYFMDKTTADVDYNRFLIDFSVAL